MSYYTDPDEIYDPDDLLIKSVMAARPREKPAMSLLKRTVWASISMIIILSMLLTWIAPAFLNRPVRDNSQDVRTLFIVNIDLS